MSVATLHFFCGKAGAGKSTTARAIAVAGGGLLRSEDVWLARLYGDQIRVFDDTVRCSRPTTARGGVLRAAGGGRGAAAAAARVLSPAGHRHGRRRAVRASSALAAR